MLVRKVSDLLDFLSRGEASAADIADAINEPRSSIYRLLSSLQTEGFVEAGSRRGQFRLGFKLLSLATAAVSRFDERKFAMPVMERLHDMTGETVFLCVPRKDDAVCIERIEGMRVRSLALQLGGSLPLHAGAAPRAILAHLPEREWTAYLDRNVPLQKFTSSTPVDAAELRAILAEIRRTGIAVSDQDVTLGVGAIGVPITDYRGQVRGALSISGIRESILGEDLPKWSDELIRGGREISESLGADMAANGIANFG